MTGTLRTLARAKVNLDLRVLGRRTDGYHELESLVAFAGIGDLMTLEPRPALSLTISGPFGAGLEADERNLILRAARRLAQEVGPIGWGHFHLVKRLPVASGIGGGSADAAAALRLLARLNGVSLKEPALLQAAAQIGADVPICLESQARVMAGIGERLGPALRLPQLFAVLVNPGVPVQTAAVFRELGLLAADVPVVAPMSVTPPDIASPAALLDRLGRSANDLESPALRIAPVLGDLLARLRDLPGCRLARMSGSGGTCFAVFDDCRQSAAAAKMLAREQAAWWVRPTVLR